jgi:hypothetical protein
MNRFYVPLAMFAVATAMCLAPNGVSAQDEDSPKFAIHAGGAYSTHAEGVGLNVGAYVPVMDKIKAGGEFTYYFVDDVGASSFTLWTLDLNARYALVPGGDGTPSVDAVGGLNITHWKGEYNFNGIFKSQGLFDGSVSDTDIGVNAGAIAEYPLGGVNLIGRANVVLSSGSSGLVIAAGISKSF